MIRDSRSHTGGSTISRGRRKLANRIESRIAQHLVERLLITRAPYLRSYIPAHVASARIWSELSQAHLDRLDPHAVRSEAFRAWHQQGSLPDDVLVEMVAATELAAALPVHRSLIRGLTAHRLRATKATAAVSSLMWCRLLPTAPHVRLAGDSGLVTAVAVTTLPDCRPIVVAASTDHAIRYWEPAGGQRLREPTKSPEQLSAIAFGTLSTGTAVLAGVSTEDLEPANNSKQRRWAPARHNGPEPGDSRMWIWNPATGKQLAEFSIGRQGRLSALAFATISDGATVIAAASTNGTVTLWDPSTGESLGNVRLGRERERARWHSPVATLATLPSGQTVLAIADERLDYPGSRTTIEVWDIFTQERITSFSSEAPHVAGAIAIATLPDGRTILAVASANTIQLWDLTTKETSGFASPGNAVLALAFGTIPDGRTVLVAAGSDRIVRLWDPTTLELASDSQITHKGRVTEVEMATSPDGSTVLASASVDRTVRLWNARTGQPFGQSITPRDYLTTSMALGNIYDGRTILATASSDDFIGLWNTATRTVLARPFGNKGGGVTAMAFATLPDRSTVLAAASADQSIQLWDITAERDRGALRSRRPRGKSLIGHEGAVTAMTFYPAGKRSLLVSSSDDGTVRFWDVETGRSSGKPLSGHDGQVSAVAIGELLGGRIVLASAGVDATVRLWDAHGRRALGPPLGGHSGPVQAVAIGTTPDGRGLLATADGHSLRWWTVADKRRSLSVRFGGSLPVSAECLKIADDILVVGCSEGVVALALAAFVRPSRRTRSCL